MQTAGQTQTDSEVVLSILQNALDQAAELQMPVKTIIQPKRVLVEISGINVCGGCGIWTTDAKCPNCKG